MRKLSLMLKRHGSQTSAANTDRIREPTNVICITVNDMEIRQVCFSILPVVMSSCWCFTKNVNWVGGPYTLLKECGHSQPRPPPNSSDPISHASLMCLGGFSHLYLVLSTFDWITEDRCWYQVRTVSLTLSILASPLLISTKILQIGFKLVLQVIAELGYSVALPCNHLSVHVCVFGGPSGHAGWIGPGEQQPARPGIAEAGCTGATRGDGPAALQARGNAQRCQAEVPGRDPDG